MYSYKKAFTLVELMIVIAVLGILMAALVPSLSTYMARGRNSSRTADVRNINIGMRNYYFDKGVTAPTTSGTEGGYCMGMRDNEMCWKEYMLNPDVTAGKGRDHGVMGNTAFIQLTSAYIGKVPIDPLAYRGVGDRYIFSSNPGDVHCAGIETVWAGGWIIWEPEQINPHTDSDCLGHGTYGCCSGIGCGSPYFCLTRVDL